MLNNTSSITIKHLPKLERPRERLQHLGPEALSASELMAIILRLGSPGVNALVLADRLLARFGNLKALAGAGVEELCSVDGMGRSKAVQLKAAFELGRRLSIFTEDIRPFIKKPQDAVNLLIDEMRLLQQETFKELILNTKNQLLKIETITVGTLNASLIHPRELFRPAIKVGAQTVILVHNHPSGDPEPSQEDIVVTQKLADAGRVVDIHIQDHIIIGDGRYVSLKEKGYM